MCRKVMKKVWLNRIAKELDWSDANDLLSKERGALVIRAEPGMLEETKAWPPDEDDPYDDNQEAMSLEPSDYDKGSKGQYLEDWIGELRDSKIYPDTDILRPPDHESSAHESRYMAALITRFGIRPMKTSADFATLKNAQESARKLEEPAMLVGVPLNIHSNPEINSDGWIDRAGLVKPGNLAVFDLRQVEVDRLS